MIAKWNDKYLTGYLIVDTQHRRLFQLVNDLHQSVTTGTSKEFQFTAVETLARYCTEHFATEERLMISTGYPGYATHKFKHDNLSAKADGIINEYKTGKLVLPITLSQFLTDWITHHIGEEDQKLVSFLKSRNA